MSENRGDVVPDTLVGINVFPKGGGELEFQTESGPVLIRFSVDSARDLASNLFHLYGAVYRLPGGGLHVPVLEATVVEAHEGGRGTQVILDVEMDGLVAMLGMTPEVADGLLTSLGNAIAEAKTKRDSRTMN